MNRLLVATLAGVASTFLGTADARGMERVRVADDGRSFVLAESGEPFVPWGFNYDHDEQGRLIEDYWETEWEKVESDFAEMKALGANVVRVHLQFGKFLPKPGEPDERRLDRLGRLLDLAERTGLYLDLTGLGCYHAADVPAWYADLPERDRWDAQARFWEAVAGRCAGRPVVFCYDLMNEPVVPGGKAETWLPGQPLGGKYFVQYVTRDRAGRERPAIAKEWVRHLVAAIRRRDRDTLVTVGLVPWSLDRPGLTSGFVPSVIASELDFIAVHLYPEAGKLDEALETLRGFAVGKPVVIEETFPLKSGPEEHATFLGRSAEVACGWIGFYWGRTIEEYDPPATFGEAFTLAWLR
ncbi:MAG TPA: cellulase family glycosylhydrolase, partial [Planctomycetaceae bacterium]